MLIKLSLGHLNFQMLSRHWKEIYGYGMRPELRKRSEQYLKPWTMCLYRDHLEKKVTQDREEVITPSLVTLLFSDQTEQQPQQAEKEWQRNKRKAREVKFLDGHTFHVSFPCATLYIQINLWANYSSAYVGFSAFFPVYVVSRCLIFFSDLFLYFSTQLPFSFILFLFFFLSFHF